MYKKVNVVMLPTNEKANLYLHETKGLHLLAPVEHEQGRYNGSNQHIYILSDDEIKEGDWCYSKSLDLVYQVKGLPLSAMDSKKIIATTDKSTKLELDGYRGNLLPDVSFDIEMPQSSRSFIEKYVEEYNKGNVITEVMVEYETEEYCLPMPNIHIKQYREILKINSDNTINIKPIKNSWSREEVVELLRKSHCLKSISFIQNNSLDKWLEENL